MTRTASTFLSIRSFLSFFLAVLCLSVTALPVRAVESAGVILAFAGKVDILRGTVTLPPAIRAELFSGDTVVTGDGQIQIRFSDGTLLTLYRETRFAVDNYRYGQGGGDRAQFSLLNGLMHTLTGQMDKQNYQLKTRLANLGVRGTEYSVELGGNLQVSVEQGRVVITNAAGTLELGAGEAAIVSAANAMPRASTRIDLRGVGQGGGRPGGAPPPGALQSLGTTPDGTAGGRPPPPGTQNLGSPSSTPTPPPPPPPHH